MAPDASTDERDPGATPSAAASTGTNAVVVYSDLRCPWAHLAVSRFLAAVERLGAEAVLQIDHRWFPLGDDAVPADPAALDRKIQPVRELHPDAGWRSWAGSDATFPASSELAAAWVQAAKASSPAASVQLDRALRRALFADGCDLTDEAVLAEVAAGVADLDVERIRTEVESGRPAAELERHAEVAGTDEVPASPTFVLADGTSWTNPGIEFHTDDDGVPVIDSDDPGVHDEIVEAFLAQRHYD